MDNSINQVTTLRDIALAYHQLADYDQAHTVLQQALTVANTITQRWERIPTVGKIATVYRQWHQGNQALTILEKALAGAETAATTVTDDTEQRCEVLGTLATQVGQLESGERSTALLKSILQEVEEIASPQERTVPLLHVAIAALQLGHVTWHQHIVDQALNGFDPDRGWLVVSVVEDLIQGAEKLPNPAHSHVVLASAQKIVSSLADDWYQLLAWQDIAKVYGSLGYEENAQAVLDQALELIHSLAVTHQQKVRALSELAIAYSAFAPQQSCELLQQSLALNKLQNSHSSIRTILDAATHLNQADQYHILKQVRATADTLSCSLAKAAALSALADGYNNLGEKATAQSLLEQALELAAPYYLPQPVEPPRAAKPHALAYIVDHAGDLQPINQIQTVFGLLLEAAEQIRHPKIQAELHQWAAIAMADWRTPSHP